MSQQAAPSIHEYALFHGLVQDHKANAPLALILPPDECTFQKALEEPQEGYTHASSLCLGDTTHLELENSRCPACFTEATNAFRIITQSERMFIDARTASVLASISQSVSTSSSFDEVLQLDNKRHRRLKHELPLLSTDHGCDVQEFSRPFTPDLENEFLPLETLDEEADEGLAWPSSCLNLPQELWQGLLTEKLEVSAEALRLVFEVANHSGRVEMFQVEDYTFEKVCLLSLVLASD